MADVEPVVPVMSDDLVTIRAPIAVDLRTLSDGRDAEFDRWLAAEDDAPPPAACIEVDGQVVGWVDYDTRRPWLEEREVNIGYFLLPGYRRRGYATRAMRLLLQHLSVRTPYEVATFAIATANLRSVAVAERLGADPSGALGDGLYFKLRFSPGLDIGDAR
jgi:RimJ/RimL family protein N-acetyltransferase